MKSTRIQKLAGITEAIDYPKKKQVVKKTEMIEKALEQIDKHLDFIDHHTRNVELAYVKNDVYQMEDLSDQMWTRLRKLKEHVK